MKKLLLFSLFVTIFFGCGSAIENTPVENKVLEVTINPEVTFQTIHNFGASDAWSCQYVGKWPDEQKNKVADLLFSLEKKEDGSPKGIGFI